MPRPPRVDSPGRRYHVVNRSHAGLAPFAGRRAQRAFLARLARAVRAGRIRIHAFTLMRNHYHLLADSLDGDVSTTMQEVQGPFALWFNHRYQHTGHVFGGRFKCFPVKHPRYLHAVVRYIDMNPVVVTPGLGPLDYEPGSARHHAAGSRRPRWLARELIDACLAAELLRGHDRREAYRRTFRPGPTDPRVFALIEARLLHPAPDEDDLADLLDASPAAWIAWLRARAIGGSRAGLPFPLADASSVIETVEARRLLAPGAVLGAAGQPSASVWPLLQAGLLRDLRCLSWCELAHAVGIDESTARRRHERHRLAIVEDPMYAVLAAAVARQAVDTCFADVRAR